jgi:hypothetical protein
VLRDAFGNRESSISEIAERTSLPQSYVSESVARLRELAHALRTADDLAVKKVLAAEHAGRATPHRAVGSAFTLGGGALIAVLGQASAAIQSS